MTPQPLFPPDWCMVCFCPPHHDGPCQTIDVDDEGSQFRCGCTEYVTEEQRGQIVVRVTEGKA